MNIGSVGASVPAHTVSGASPVMGGRFEGQLQGVMSDMTGLLGVSTQQLNTSVSQSGSLSSVAADKGMTQETLVDAIKQGLQSAGSTLTGTRLDNIATRIAHSRGLHANDADSLSAAQVSSATLTPGTWRATHATSASPST